VLKVIQLPKDSKPMGVVVSPDGKRVYVANGRGGTVSVIDAATNAVTATIPVGQRPWGIDLTHDGAKLYTANGPSNDVSVVDTRKMQVVKKIPAGKIPWGVAVGNAPGGAR
jgi:YVTN family beta-propeller protein